MDKLADRSQVRGRRKSKPTVSVVGSGRLGTALARALASSGYSVQAVVARSSAHARKAASYLGHPILALGANQLGKLPLSEIVLITTPDDMIAATSRELAGLQKGTLQGQTALHTSGALSSDVLSPLAEFGVRPAIGGTIGH